MSRLRVLQVIGLLSIACSGCVRYSTSRIYLRGDTVDEDLRPVPHAVVRLGDRETVSDARGKYRFLYLDRCLRVGAGTLGIKNDTIRSFAPGFEPFAVGFHLDSIELVGGSMCPKDVEKFLRLTLVKKAL